MEYKIGANFIHEFLNKGLVDKTVPEKEKKPKEADSFTGTLLSEYKKLENLVSNWSEDDIYKQLIRISLYLAYKIENRQTASIPASKLIEIIITILGKEKPDVATAAMNCVGNALFFYREDCMHEIYEQSFIAIINNIIGGNSPLDLLVETLPVISNMLSLTKIDDKEHKEELLKLVDLEQISEISAKCNVEFFENISTILFRYISFQNEDILLKEYFKIIQIAARMLKRFKNWAIKDNEEQSSTVDRILSSMVNIMSLILIHQPRRYIDIVDSDVISEAISYFAPENELICASTLIFLMNVWNEAPKHLGKVIFSEIDFVMILLVFKVLYHLKPLALSVLTAHIWFFPLESNEPELLGIVKELIDLAAESEIRNRIPAFELLSCIFCETNDKNRMFLFKEGFLDVIEDCLEFHSPTNIKLVQNILLFADRSNISLSADLVKSMYENIEDISQSDKKYLANQANIVLSLFPEEK